MSAELMATSNRLAAGRAFQAQRPAARARSLRVACIAQQGDVKHHTSRRELLTLAGATIAASQIVAGPSAAVEYTIIPPATLSVFQRQDQRAEFIKRVTAVLAKYLTAADSTACIKLALHDAGTYDEDTKTGGMDGSIVVSEELNRPENESLKPLVARLTEAKKEIDAGAKEGQSGISWPDLIVLAAKLATQLSWIKIKVGRAATESGGMMIAQNFATDWPVQLGRVENLQAAPAGRIPQPGASVEDITAYLQNLGAKPDQKKASFFGPKPPFWERPGFVIWTAAADDPAAEEARFAAASQAYADVKKKYDISRNTVTRTDYEVDFVTYFAKLTSLGAKFDPDAYLYPIQMEKRRL